MLLLNQFDDGDDDGDDDDDDDGVVWILPPLSFVCQVRCQESHNDCARDVGDQKPA